MRQYKYIILGVCAGIILLAVGGWMFWRSHQAAPSKVRAAATTAQPTNNVIPLTPAGTQAEESGGLSVTSSNASSSIGQLDGSGRHTNNDSTGAGNGSTGSSPIDPKTFSQYEKYKDSPNALFGEVQAGNGAELTAGKQAAVYYRGWLTNGQFFDQSRTGNDGKLEPFVFTMGAHQVIPGWEQGLGGMKVGGVRLLIVPPAVGYGATGQGTIPPNAVLIFQVQLAAVQ